MRGEAAGALVTSGKTLQLPLSELLFARCCCRS